MKVLGSSLLESNGCSGMQKTICKSTEINSNAKPILLIKYGPKTYSLVSRGILVLMVAAAVVFVTDDANASTINISIPSGSSTPGCESSNSCFQPSSISISTGDAVVWTNDDTAAHTVTSGTATDGPDGVFDSGLLPAGNTFSVTFDKSGTYQYFCQVHPWMLGSLLVQEAAPAAPAKKVVPEFDLETNVVGPNSISIDFIDEDSNLVQPQIDYRVKIMQGGNTLINIPLTHTSEGQVKIPFTVNSPGGITITATIEGVLFEPVTPQSYSKKYTIVAPTPEPEIQQGSIDLKGLELLFESQYTQILSGTIDQENHSVILYVQTSNDDVVTLTIPRSLLDATTNGQDDSFFVLTDGEETQYEQTSSTSTSRTIVIFVVRETKEIEVIGTEVYGDNQKADTSSSQGEQTQTVKEPATQSPDQSEMQQTAPTENVGPQVYGAVGGSVAIGVIVLLFAMRRKKRKSDEDVPAATPSSPSEPDFSLDDSKLK